VWPRLSRSAQSGHETPAPARPQSLQAETRATGVAPPAAESPFQGGLLQRACACGGTPGLDGLCDACRAGAAALGPGEPLAGPERTRTEARLRTDAGGVRIHRGPEAERAAAGLGAQAFAVGQDVVLGGGADERVLAHEVAHAVQQSGAVPIRDAPLPRTSPGGPEERQADAASLGLERPAPGAKLALAAAPPAAQLPFTPDRTFKEIWPEFVRARADLELTKATDLAKALATAPFDFDDVLTHGIAVVAWLQRNGEPVLANRMLDEVRNVWMIHFVTIGSSLPSLNVLQWSDNDPGTLVGLGKEAARAGKHDDAFRLFGAANELLSFYALEATERRSTVLAEESVEDEKLLEESKDDPARRDAILSALFLPRLIARSFQYSSLKSLYDQMREIYGFYSVLEREALTAGDAKAAADARAKSDELHRELLEKYTWGGVQRAGPITQQVLEPVELTEVTLTETRKGPGLTMHGANDAETELTALPGLPSPKEIGNNVQVQNLGALQTALMAQTDFQAELAREPEIRKAFGNEPIDLNDTSKRQRAWRIMYGVFKTAGPGALGKLMALVGRYLKAYTIHTTYNIRDWGTSYLDSPLPTDLAGRAERDCGVYALTVAWDVYETVKRADSKLDVTFRLTTMLEHVTLVITDTAAGEHYVVNNDTVTGPHTGDPLEQVAPQYGAIRGLPYTVGPAVTVDLGSTKLPEKSFHDDAWRRYLAAVDWGLHLDVPADVRALEKTDPAKFEEKMLAIQKLRYEEFYARQELFDRKAKELDPLVTALGPLAADAAKLAPALDPLVERAGGLAVLFVQLGPRAGIDAGSEAARKLLPPKTQYLFTQEEGHAVHPITRVALAVLHVQALGGAPTAKGQAVVDFCDAVPQFKRQLDAYRAAGATGPF
jgi:hypothetical protein